MQALSDFEGRILLLIQESVRCPLLDGPMRLVSTLGNVGAVWTALALALLLFRRTRRYGAACALALTFSLLVTNMALKNIIHRIRPYDVISSLNILVNPERDFSFPSGHASSSFAAAWALWRGGERRLGAPALVLAVLIALSRLYVGVHYPTDVLVGTAVGMLCGEAGHRLAERFLARN